MGIRGWGGSPAEAFEEAAAAMFELTADLRGLDPRHEAALSCTGDGPEELLVEFLNALIARADLDEVVFVRVTIDDLARTGKHWTLTARALGAARDAAAGRFLTEVKAATYYGAAVVRDDDGRWEARCVVDL
jgi:SHS2 domain-containing protein